jgi:protein-S-isoprenylcysteine O-methyltransferase Ste14
MSTNANVARRLPLLSRMADDMERHGSLRRSTAAAMYTAYAAHTALTGWALVGRGAPLPLAPVAARVAGAGLSAVGGGACVAGMSRFAGVDTVSGTSNQTLLTTGIYRYSRNPQYLGYLTSLVGVSLARRSGAGLASTAVLAAIYAAWIPVEEAHLTRLSGEPYTRYAERTRRWWGRR